MYTYRHNGGEQTDTRTGGPNGYTNRGDERTHGQNRDGHTHRQADRQTDTQLDMGGTEIGTYERNKLNSKKTH